MKKMLVAIEDVFTGFAKPAIVNSREHAARDFKLICKDDVRADDLRLWEVGEFDTETGEIFPKKPDLIMKGAADD